MEINLVSNILNFFTKNNNLGMKLNDGISTETIQISGQTLRYSNHNYNDPVIKSYLTSPDILFKTVSPKSIPVYGIFDNNQKLINIQNISLNSARTEWKNKAREDLGTNTGRLINKYYQNSGFTPGKWGWCGFFVAYNYAQAGFKHSSSLAGMEKARDFFLYRQYTDMSTEKRSSLDKLKLEQQQNGSVRKYFMLQESPSVKYIQKSPGIYKNFNLSENVFNYKNIPIQPGDTILFNTGVPGGHVGIVESYNNLTGQLITIEGNTTGLGPDGKNHSNATARKFYDLTKPEIRKKIEGFGRPSVHDFNG